jgi:hypothetical protein
MTWRALSVRPSDILYSLDPRSLSQMASHDVASIVCQALRHPLRLKPSVLSHMASHDVASIVCQALRHPLRLKPSVLSHMASHNVVSIIRQALPRAHPTQCRTPLCRARSAACPPPPPRALHTSTFQVNVSNFRGMRWVICRVSRRR